jgi:hypothetical protein
LLRDSSPSAEAVIREEMVRAHVVALDDAFINPSNQGLFDDSNVQYKPMSILHGATQGNLSSPAAGITPEDTLEGLLNNFGGDLENSVLIMHPFVAARLASSDRPRIGANGGDWAGIKVVTSSNVPGGTGDGLIALVDPQGIAVSLPDDGSEIRISRNGTVDMLQVSSQSSGRGPTADTSESPAFDSTPIHTDVVSLFATNSVAILAERRASWRVIRSNCVVWSSGLGF